MLKTSLNAMLFLIVLFASMTANAALLDAKDSLKAGRYKEAFDEFSYLATEGSSEAEYNLGYMYEMGLGVSVNYSQALNYYNRASLKSNPDAVFRKALLTLKGKGTPKNVKEALSKLKTIARDKHKEALFELGELYAKGEDVARNYSYAYGFYYSSALEGYAPAQYKLAILYLYGRGVPQDYQRALGWFKRASDQGYVGAQRDLAELLATDKLLYNPSEAYAWYSIIAAYNSDALGDWAVKRRNEIYSKIKDVKNLVKAQELARKWRPVSPKETVPDREYEKARPIVPGFNDQATLNKLKTGKDYMIQEGARFALTRADIDEALVTKNFVQVEAKINVIAKQGRKEAYAYLGDVFAKMAGNETQAFKWYQKGANINEPTAQTRLATFYCEGKKPASVDLVECYKWLSLAEKGAGLSAKVQIRDAMTSLEGKLSDTDLVEARKKVSLFQESHEEPGLLKKLFK